MHTSGCRVRVRVLKLGARTCSGTRRCDRTKCACPGELPNSPALRLRAAVCTSPSVSGAAASEMDLYVLTWQSTNQTCAPSPMRGWPSVPSILIGMCKPGHRTVRLKPAGTARDGVAAKLRLGLHRQWRRFVPVSGSARLALPGLVNVARRAYTCQSAGKARSVIEQCIVLFRSRLDAKGGIFLVSARKIVS